LPTRGNQVQPGVWLGKDTKIGSAVRFIPPVLIGDNVEVGDQSVIGPFAVIGDHCRIGSKVHFSNSILWDQSSISDNIRVNNSIMAYKTFLNEGKVYDNLILNQYERVMQA